jgi:predicted phosphodiesterase
MRIALISDLHGNAVALRAVLADIAAAGVDRTVCLGDTATLGPSPREVIQSLRDLGCDCILGNHDDFMNDPALVRTYTEAPAVIDAVDWCRAQLSSDDLAFIARFQPTLEIALGDGATLFLFHGSPRSHTKDILSTTPADELDRLLDGHAATVMAGGHTHLQMLRQHNGTLLVNPGSVGMPFKEYVGGRPPTILPHAEYAIVEASRGGVTVHLRRVSLDKRALHDAAASASSNPVCRFLAQQYA